MRLIIISGRSGSGKTIALHALEDLGFYCIDNLPATLLPELEQHISHVHTQIAVSIDARNLSEDLLHFKEVISLLQNKSVQCDIIYLDADENTLLKRFSETRRKHPLTSVDTSLREAIRREHTLLAPIANLATVFINTRVLNKQELYQLIRDRISAEASHQLQLLLQSFGFKYGIPPDADFIFDVRCLPNPYWASHLRPLTGLDQPVIDFLQKDPQASAMVQSLRQFLLDWIPQFALDQRSYLTVAIGCTGGRHRSVFIVNALAKEIQSSNAQIQTRHRDLSTLS